MLGFISHKNRFCVDCIQTLFASTYLAKIGVFYKEKYNKILRIRKTKIPQLKSRYKISLLHFNLKLLIFSRTNATELNLKILLLFGNKLCSTTRGGSPVSIKMRLIHLFCKLIAVIKGQPAGYYLDPETITNKPKCRYTKPCWGTQQK